MPKPNLKKSPRARKSNEVSYSDVKNFYDKNESLKSLKKELDPIKDKIKSAMGVEDTKFFADKSGKDSFKVSNSLKVATSYSAHAADIIKKRLSKVQVKSLIETIEVVRFDILEDMIVNSKIPDDVVKELVILTESRALTVSKQK